MFPGARAQVYRNEAGEPLGWDYPSDEPYEPDDYLDANDRGWPVKCRSCGLHLGMSDELEDEDLLDHNEICDGPVELTPEEALAQVWDR